MVAFVDDREEQFEFRNFFSFLEFFLDGKTFDSSYDRGQPITFGLNGVIAGWQMGIPGMKVGGKRRLIIPASLAYGGQAVGTIPANSDLVFEVELLAINPK